MSEKVKKFVSVIGGKLDITCDECGGKMRPGGHYQLDVGGKTYQFCSEKCMDAFEAKMS
ncbi:MAG: YHS domain-containing protein [Candidatus Thorarchaeota archaeon]